MPARKHGARIITYELRQFQVYSRLLQLEIRFPTRTTCQTGPKLSRIGVPRFDCYMSHPCLNAESAYIIPPAGFGIKQFSSHSGNKDEDVSWLSDLITTNTPNVRILSSTNFMRNSGNLSEAILRWHSTF